MVNKRKINKHITENTKRVARRATPHIKRVSKTVVRQGAHVTKAGARQTVRAARKAHRVATIPHIYMKDNWMWYARWHNWKWHRVVHYSTLGTYLLMVGLVLFSTFRTALAADLTNNWDFSNPGDYALDSGVEISGNSARLKAQEYSSDVNTALLAHLNESSGTNVSDSSSNSNNGTASSAPTWGGSHINGTVSLNGANQNISVPDSPSLSVTGQQTVEGWIKPSSTFDNNSTENQTIVDKGSYKLGLERTNGKLTYEISNNDSQWTKRLGDDLNGSWSFGHYTVDSMITYGTDIIVGTGVLRGDGEVWRYNGSTWTKIGGDGIRSSWADQTYETVPSLAINGNALYAGLGSSAGDGEVWTCNISTNCASWTKIAGDGLGGFIASLQTVSSMTTHGGSLYVGTGNAAGGFGDVWKYNGGTSWTQIGGDGLTGSWAASIYDEVSSLHSDGTYLYAGLGNTTTEAEVWRYSGIGTSWTQIGGDGIASSWNTSFEAVRSMTSFGGNLYAGLGDGGNDADVWKYNGSSWTQIGGDGIASSWNSGNISRTTALANDGTNLYAANGANTAAGDVYRYNGTTWTKIGGASLNGSWVSNPRSTTGALVYANSKLYATPWGSSAGGEAWEYDGSNWTMIGGNFVNESWGGATVTRIASSTVMNSKVYFGLGGGVNSAQVYEYDGTTARRIGGSALAGSWPVNTYEEVTALMAYKGALYAGLGNSAGDAELYKWDGSSWTQVGGNGLNSSWSVLSESSVRSMTTWRGNLYVGLGTNAYMGQIWQWDGSSWTQVAGSNSARTATINNSWLDSPRSVESMTVYNGQLCAALGGSGTFGVVWCWGGSGSWTRISGGQSAGTQINNSWLTAVEVTQLRVYNGKMYAGVVGGTHSVTIWQWDGSSWTQVGGQDINSSWSDGMYTYPRSFATYNGELYLGVAYSGSSNPTGDVWKYDGTSWTQVGGDGLQNSWAAADFKEEVSTLVTYKGKLYAGLGFSANLDPLVYAYGNNGYVESSTTSFDTSWHHVAATYDGITMKLYVDGTQVGAATVAATGVDNSSPLLIGSSFGSTQSGDSQGFFKGSLDEIRISNIARTSFNAKPYPTSPQAVVLANAVRKSGVEDWESFTANETTNGGTVTYRLSDDDGASWKYWNGSSWAVSGGLAQASLAVIVSGNIGAFPVTFDGIKWQAVLTGDGSQRVTLNSVELAANSDNNGPDTNASSLAAFKSSGGASIASNAWTNSGSPYFTWDAGTDSGAGIIGYCLYLGTTPSADPVTTKGLLGAGPLDVGNSCQFAVAGNSLDLSTPGLLRTALTSSNTPYYLNVKAIDKAGNTFDTSEQLQFRFDNTAPSNPGYVSAPSGFINSKTATVTWPTGGGDAASDANSGVAGLQYKIGSSSWYGDSHTGTGDANDLLDDDGNYTTVDPPDFDNISDGINTVYFRTWDQAGNFTTSYTTAVLKVNTNGAPSEPQNLVANPVTRTTNAFAFEWDAPQTFNTTTGQPDKLSYCYVVNTLPNANNCNFTVPGREFLEEGPFATQPGSNTLYVVAKDDFNAINYSSYASVTFTANTAAPGMPTNLDVADVSVKVTSNWRLAVTWDEPTSLGAGVSGYQVYRSTDNSAFTKVGTSSSTSYVDSGLTQVMYYYKVRACDSANNCGAYTGVGSQIPTGKFTEPATMTSEPVVSDVTTKRATIRWSTDRTSDSKIAIGTTSGEYSPSEIGNSAQVTAHKIDLDNLAAGTTYYIKVRWADADGNVGSSQEYSFTTAPAPLLKEVSTLAVNLSSATIQFTIKDAAKVEVNFGKSDSFGGEKTINTSLTESTYAIALEGLEDGVKYFYRLGMFDSEGGKYISSIFSFTTPPRPKISNLRFQPLVGEPTSTQQVTWDTNITTNSMVTYGKIGTDGTVIQTTELKTGHEIIVRGLEDNSEYFLIAQGRDSNGNVAVSDRQVFKTALDTRPPQINEIVIEPTIRGTGAEARGQIVVSWRTDEPSTSQVAFAEGSAVVTFNNRTAEDAQLTTEHLVIISDLPPSKVYSIMPISKDRSGNASTTKPQAAIIGRASDSVLNIVLNTLRKVFGL